MSLPTCLKQCIQDSASHTEIRVHPDTNPRRDLIRRPESDSINIVRQPVRIFPDDTINILSVCLIYLDR